MLASSRHSGSNLPDIDSISLDDAEWFQAGIPRLVFVRRKTLNLDSGHTSQWMFSVCAYSQHSTYGCVYTEASLPSIHTCPALPWTVPWVFQS